MAKTTVATTTTEHFDPLLTVWRFFTSVRVALSIIGLIAICTFIGTLVPQAAQAGLFDDVAYQNWLIFQRNKFGDFVPLMDFLGLFHIFQSFYFRTLLILLTISIICCTINRVPGIWRAAMHAPPIRVGDKLFTVHPTARRLETSAATPVGLLDHLTQTLRGKRYRVLTQTVDDRVYVFADKNRFGIFGTFVSHVGLVLVLAGALIGSIWGWRDDVFTITDNSTREIGHGTNLAVRNDLFVDEYDPATGQPSDFYTNAVLLEKRNGEWVEVQQHRIRVNTPLSYDGVVVHQAFFGAAAVLTIKDNQGNVIFSDGIPMPYRNPDGRPIGWVDIPAGRFPIPLSVYVTGRAPVGPGGDPSIQPGQVMVEVYPGGQVTADTLLYAALLDVGQVDAMKAPVNGRTLLEFTFERERQFTGLNVSYNPGLPIIWTACVLMVLGWSSVFYFPHRRLRAMVAPAAGHVLLGTAMISKLDLGAGSEYERILEEVERRLGTTSAAPVAAAAD